mgnify:CR=1 FL=1
MEKQFVTYEIGLKLKEKGFNVVVKSNPRVTPEVSELNTSEV